MQGKVVLVTSAALGADLAPRLPPGVALKTFSDRDQALALAPEAEIGWFDHAEGGTSFKAPTAAVNAKWINTTGVGLDAFRTDLFLKRGQIFTNGIGLRSDAIGEFALLGVLALARRLDEIVRAHDRHEWIKPPPGTRHLSGTRALILGYGSIGSAIGERLRAFGVDVTGVRRSPSADAAIIGPNDWRDRLGEFDWLVLAAPGTSATRHMISSEELATMKRGSAIINISRGALIDEPALICALKSGQIGGAFLDPTAREPLPYDDPLWNAPNTLNTMHMAGAGHPHGHRLGVERFLANLDRYLKGEPLHYVVDVARGY